MSPQTVSIVKGKGNLKHNTRSQKKTPQSVDPHLTYRNINYINESLEEAYEKLFGDAVRAYNDKVKEKHPERVIDNYLEKIKRSKQEKDFYEFIIEIGNKNTVSGFFQETSVQDALSMYVESFQERNPNFYIFGAYLHRDEPDSAPHVHLDVIPWCSDNKRGMETKTSISGAFKQMGFSRNGFKEWRDREESALIECMKAHNLEFTRGDGRDQHFNTPEFKEYTAERDKLKGEKKYWEDSIELDKKVFNEDHQKMRDNYFSEKNELEEVNSSLKAENEALLNENKQLAAKQAELDSINEAINEGDNTLQEQHKIINANRLTIAKQSSHLQDVTKQVKDKEKLSKELENVEEDIQNAQNRLKNVRIQAKMVEDELQSTFEIKSPTELKKPLQRKDEVTFKRSEWEKYEKTNKKMANDAIIVMKSSDRHEKENIERSEQLDQRELNVKKMESDAKQKQKAADDAYNKQKNLNAMYEQSERNNRQLAKAYSSLEADYTELKKENSKLKPLQEEVSQWKNKFIQACEHLTGITKAINYISDQIDLPAPISNLIKGISKYTENFLHKHEQYEMRIDVENNHEVSEEIKEATQDVKIDNHRKMHRGIQI